MRKVLAIMIVLMTVVAAFAFADTVDSKSLTVTYTEDAFINVAFLKKNTDVTASDITDASGITETYDDIKNESIYAYAYSNVNFTCSLSCEVKNSAGNVIENAFSYSDDVDTTTEHSFTSDGIQQLGTLSGFQFSDNLVADTYTAVVTVAITAA